MYSSNESGQQRFLCSSEHVVYEEREAKQNLSLGMWVGFFFSFFWDVVVGSFVCRFKPGCIYRDVFMWSSPRYPNSD